MVLKNQKAIEKRERCIASYSSNSKLKAVKRWKVRMVKAGVAAKTIAHDIGIPAPHLSDYMSFLYEPPEERFMAVEEALYKRGA